MQPSTSTLLSTLKSISQATVYPASIKPSMRHLNPHLPSSNYKVYPKPPIPSNKRKELVVCQSQSAGLSHGLEFFSNRRRGYNSHVKGRGSRLGGDGELRKKRNSLHDPEGSIEVRASLSSLFPLIRPSVNHDQLLSLTRLYVAVKSKESRRDEAKSKTKDGHSLSGIDSELDWVDSKRVQRQKQGKEGEARTSKTGAGRSLSGIDGELDWVGSKRAQQQAGQRQGKVMRQGNRRTAVKEGR